MDEQTTTLAITVETSIALKAVAIILVLTGQIIPPFSSLHELDLPTKSFLSQVGVNIFMFLSGYGIYSVYLTGRYSSRHFLVRRFLKTWPLYSVCVGMYYIFQVFIFKSTISPASLASHLVGLHVYFDFKNDIMPLFYFMSAISTVYLSAALALFMKKENNRIFTLVTIIFGQSLFFLITSGEIYFIDYFASFLVGIGWAKYYRDKKFTLNFFVVCAPLFLLPADPYKTAVFLTCIISLPLLIKLSRALLHNRSRLRKVTLWIGGEEEKRGADNKKI